MSWLELVCWEVVAGCMVALGKHEWTLARYIAHQKSMLHQQRGHTDTGNSAIRRSARYD